MALLKERLKRASKNNTLPVATVQPTVKMVESPDEQIPDINNTVSDYYNTDNEDNEYNATFDVSQGHNFESRTQRYSNDLSGFENYPSYRTENVLTSVESTLEIGFG